MQINEERKRQLRLWRHMGGSFYKWSPEYLACIASGESLDELLKPEAKPVLNDLTASESEQLNEANSVKLHTEPTLASLFPEYQNWRKAGQRVLNYEAGRFQNYLRSSLLFNTPISQLDDVQAADFLQRLEDDGVDFTPRLEAKKTLSQMASFLREKGKRRGPLLFQKLKVTKSKADKKSGSKGKRDKKKLYHPRAEIPVIFSTLQLRIEEGKNGARDPFDAAASMYWGAFRPVELRGDSEPDVGGLRWEHISWAPFEITYWNSKCERWDTKNPKSDLKAVLEARWERQGKPESGLVFFNEATGENFCSSYDWGLDDIIHNEAGITKKRGRKLYGFRHAAAIAAGSGVWGAKWSKEEVAKLLNDTSDAVDEYFDIIDETMHELASNTTSEMDAWGLTIGNAIDETSAHVTGDQRVSARPPCQG